VQQGSLAHSKGVVLDVVCLPHPHEYGPPPALRSASTYERLAV
jgi:hypothetical protein